MEEMLGKQVGSYVVTEFIGEGGMGTVWAGRHQTIDRKVAIKVLHPQYARNERVRQRFRNEASTLARLQHPNIVTLYDYVETPQQLCLVMEHVEGVNLDDMIRTQTGPLTNDRLGPIFRQILDAISYAHRQKVIHRDIKPSNFMVTPKGEVKVLDFGIAKLLEDDQQLTRTGMKMGTTFFMSPEQINSGTVDHRSDIYALGVTLFVLATGKVPYDGETSEFQVYTKIINEPLPKASSVYVGVSSGVERMIEKATQKRPADRFQTCEEFFATPAQAATAQPRVETPPQRQSNPVQSSPAPQARQSFAQPAQPLQSQPTGVIQEPPYVGLKIFGISSAVVMLLVGLFVFVLSGSILNALSEYGYYIELWGETIPADDDARTALGLIAGLLLVLGLIFSAAGAAGIGITMRHRWGQIMGIVAYALIGLLTLIALLITVGVRNSGELSYREEGVASTIILAEMVLFAFCIWAFITLFGPWAGGYFGRRER